MTKYTTLLLDADETLLDFKFAEHFAIKTVCEKHGIPFDDTVAACYSKINQNLWEMLEKGLVTRDQIKLRRFEEFAAVQKSNANPQDMAQDYILALSSCGKTLEGADKLLLDLSQKYRLYIVTNGITFVQERRLAASGLLPYFNDIFISEKFGSAKPKREFFEKIFALIPEKDLSKMCIIGDSLSSDIQGGINAGIDTCYLSKNTENLAVCPTYTAKDYTQIREIFLYETQ